MQKIIDIVGVPCDLGVGRSGARQGPDALMRSGFVEALTHAGHEVSYTDLRTTNAHACAFDSIRVPRGFIHYEEELRTVLGDLRRRTRESFREGRLPLVVGGDHSIAIGSIGAALASYDHLGCIWIDAHYDAHDERTSRSHHANGMPLGLLLGRGASHLKKVLRGHELDPQHVLHIGAGDTDCEPEEVAWLRELGVPRFTMKDLKRDGWTPVFQAFARLAEQVSHLCVSFDLDAVRRRWCPGVSFRSEHGITRSELLRLADRIAATAKVSLVDIAEYNPRFEEYDSHDRPKTAQCATDFAVQLLQGV